MEAALNRRATLRGRLAAVSPTNIDYEAEFGRCSDAAASHWVNTCLFAEKYVSWRPEPQVSRLDLNHFSETYLRSHYYY